MVFQMINIFYLTCKIVNDLQITRKTAANYLKKLIEQKFLTKHKIGTENFYINNALYDYLYNAPELLKFKKIEKQ